MTARFRSTPALLLQALLLALLGATLLAPAAHADDQLQPTRTLFLTERVQPTKVRAPLPGSIQPHAMVVLQGEREGFQLALGNTTGRALDLSARITPDESLAGALASDAISVELLRIGMVNVRQPSTGSTQGTGMFADPLPPFVDTAAGGQLAVASGQWGGAVALFAIRTDASAQTYTGTLELYSGATVYARQPFTLDVRGMRIKRSSEQGGFKTIMGVEGEAYWLQHDNLRNRMDGIEADRAIQLAALNTFMDSRGVTPLDMQLGNPDTQGNYTCLDRATRLGISYPFLRQINERYFGTQRGIDPETPQFAARILPSHTWGCNIDKSIGEFTGLVDPRRTSSVRQDDRLDPKAAAYYRNVASAWKTNGWFTPATYVKNPFDEPSDVTPDMRRTMNVEVPKANRTIRQALRGNGSAKIFLASWPRQGGRTRVCGGTGSARKCMDAKLDPNGNERLWDNKGGDDPDVWMPPMTQIFGMITTPKLKSDYGVNRDRIYADRLKRIRERHTGGGETWSYSFATGTEQLPQTNIDSPGTDPRLIYSILASEGITGYYMSNSMLGWGNRNQTQRHASGRVRKGNPYRDVPYFEHKLFGIAAGWGTLIYPGYMPELGLGSEARRNSLDAVPVSSLRMEGMRDGQEDANLIAMYRERFGDTRTQKVLASVVPRSYRPLPKGRGQTMFVRYDNGHNLPRRMEAVRRQMIDALTR